MPDLASWDLVRVFLALSRLQKFEAAAHQLGLDSTTVRRKLQKLEKIVGGPLFDSDGGVLTVRGDHQLLFETAKEMESAARRFANSAVHSASAGSIRLSVIDIIGRLLTPEFAGFTAAHPGISLDVTTETHFVDLDADRVDIAIRMARPERGRHGLRKVADVDFAVYGSRAYLSSLAQDAARPLDLVVLKPHFPHRDHDFSLAEDRWFLSMERPLVFAGSTDNYPMLHAMCREGMGLALLPRFLGAGDPQLGEYRAAEDPYRIPLWIVIREDSAQAPKVRRLVDYLVDRFKDYRPLLNGKRNAGDDGESDDAEPRG
ncbi:LysR family transcriptional regulator [Rhizobium sp. DKSPLA3]|uniref:LysR family transcriptional regulator n=1 Tax=Rhizobium quercicola TaxID=2901226 RepID=A0A9X1NP49_9HYPH|nr:LysR family transcriptional regulator [Rhizobium quercicola]MCD7107810.1 LysR family transcriptional regulator [Rhizobium quercicola]